MRTPYRIDDFQQIYFVIPSLDELQRVTLQDFGALYERLAQLEDIPIETVARDDVVLTLGNQSQVSARD